MRGLWLEIVDELLDEYGDGLPVWGGRGLAQRPPSCPVRKGQLPFISIRLCNSDYGHGHMGDKHRTQCPKKDVEGHDVPSFPQNLTRAPAWLEELV